MAKNSEKHKRNSGVSTVFGTLLFLILIVFVASSIFLTLYQYNESTQRANAIENMRAQERIILYDIETLNGNVIGVYINNSGSVTVQLKAFYVNNEFICDPSSYALNSNGAYINAQHSDLIYVEPVPYDPTARITVATSRGIRHIELESNLIIGSNSTSAPPETYYGPLRLNFTLFYHRQVDSGGSAIGPWLEGSNVSSSIDYCEWNITVTNIDLRSITLSQYCSLTLVTNEGGSQYPWYTNYPGQFIGSQQTARITYIWKTPLPSSDAQGFQGFNSPTSKVFLTFYGKFSDGKDYGQTIPFEAVMRL